MTEWTTLRGEAARRWIEQNKDKDFIKISQGGKEEYIKGDWGLVGNILRGIAQPFVDTGRIVAQGVTDVGKKFNPKFKFLGKDNFLTQEERENTPEFLGKTALGVATTFIPFGLGKVGTVGRAITTGATGAALGNISQQQLGKGIDVKDALTSAALGGITGGVLGKLTQRVSPTAQQNITKARNTQELLEQGAKLMVQNKITPIVNKFDIPVVEGNFLQRLGKNIVLDDMLKMTGGFGRDFLRGKQAEKATIAKVLDELKLPYNVEGIQKALDALKGGARTYINQNADKISGVSINDFIEQASDKITKKINAMGTDKFDNIDFKGKIQKYIQENILPSQPNGNIIDAKDLYDLMVNTTNERIRLAKAMQRGVPEETLLFKAGLEEAARDILNQKIPNLKQQSNALRLFAEATPDIANYSNRTGNVSSAGKIDPKSELGKFLIQNTGRIIKRAGDVIDSGLGVKTLANKIENAQIPKAIQDVAKILKDKPVLIPAVASTLGKADQAKLRRELLIELSLDDVEREKNERIQSGDIQPNNIEDIIIKDTDVQKSLSKYFEDTADQRKRVLATALMATGGDINKALSLANFLAPERRKLGVEEKKYIYITSESLAGAKNMKNILAKHGYNPDRLVLASSLGGGLLNPLLDTDTQLFKLASLQMREGALRLKSGAAVTEKEYQRLIGLIPNFGDKPEVVKRKIEDYENAIKMLLPFNYNTY